MADSVSVVARVRPLSNYEIDNGACSVVSTSDTTITLTLSEKQCCDFVFHKILPESSTQEETFLHTNTTTLLDKAIEGYSSAILCYGQTSSGKTHTLFSPPTPETEDDLGITFRSLSYLFSNLPDSSLSASFVEVYNNEVFDLLNECQQVSLRFDTKRQLFFTEGAFVVKCDSIDDCLAVINEGLSNRTVGSHLVNPDSSRSHGIFTIYLTNGGKVLFCDLAGSEKVKRTGSSGQTLTESRHINKSLHHLGTVISAKSKKSNHVSFRDTKLTSLLMDSFSGYVLLIGTISPANCYFDETLSTLKYCTIAKKIKNTPVKKNQEDSQEVLRLRQEVELLKAKIVEYEQQMLNDDSIQSRSISSNQSINYDERQTLLAFNELKTSLARKNRKSSDVRSQKTSSDLESLRKANVQLKNTIVELRRRESIYQTQLEQLLEKELSDCL
ncbi:hypothetical protein P9112_006594 [Eukaryota sp. TZLM1-RC]